MGLKLVSGFEHKRFLDVLAARRLEAKRSILVQVQSANSYKDLYNYCSSVGTVQEMYHYKAGIEPMVFERKIRVIIIIRLHFSTLL